MSWHVEKNWPVIEADTGLANLQALELHQPGIKGSAGMNAVKGIRKNTLFE